MVETPLPSREEVQADLERWGEPSGLYNDFADVIDAYASGRLVDREAIDYQAALAKYYSTPGRGSLTLHGVRLIVDAAIGGSDE